MIRNAKVIVQGMTGVTGSFQTEQMLLYGTNIVAGVTPGKGGQSLFEKPIYDSVKEAVQKHDPSWSVLFVPAAHAKGAALEALREGLHLVIITEHIPVHDAIAIIQEAKRRKRKVFGPNGPGITVVGRAKLGIMPNHIFKEGTVGIVSRSGTLTYEIIHQLTQAGIGQSTCVGIGGDRCIGMTFVDVLRYLEKDKNTKQVVLIGEIGGSLEEDAARYIQKMSKPVVAFIAGRSAPEGKQMGHAGAIAGANGSAKHKIKVLRNQDITVAKTPSGVVRALKANF